MRKPSIDSRLATVIPTRSMVASASVDEIYAWLFCCTGDEMPWGKDAIGFKEFLFRRWVTQLCVKRKLAIATSRAAASVHRLHRRSAAALSHEPVRRIMTRSLASWTSRCAALALLTGGLLCGCAMVTVSSQGPEQYIAMRRGDILSTGRLSAATRDTLHIAALDGNTCQREPLDCINTISTVDGINTDRRLSSLAELSLQMAITNTPGQRQRLERRAIRSVARGRAIRVCISVPR
ncbi:hypothetical protein OKW39_006091 [Paraburkholderia sp. MM6662-R1]